MSHVQGYRKDTQVAHTARAKTARVKESCAWETDSRDSQAILDQYRIPGLPRLPTASCKQTDTWTGSHSKYVTLAAGSVTRREALEARIGGTVQSYGDI